MTPCAFCEAIGASNTHSERYSWNRVPIRFWYRLCEVCELAQRNGWFRDWRWERKGQALKRMMERIDREG